MSTALDPFSLEDIRKRLRKYAPVEISLDNIVLSASEKAVVDKLITAAGLMNEIYWKQMSESGLRLRGLLSRSKKPEDREALRLLRLNFGPWDVLDNDQPFIGSQEHPPGCNFYPLDLSHDEFADYLRSHPSVKDDFEKPTTLVRRRNGALVAIPYKQEFAGQLQTASGLLIEASRTSEDASFSRYLRARSEDLLTDNYTNSDVVWIDLKENRLDLVIGPIETYDDRLFGLKASYEGMVLVKDFDWMRKVKLFERHALDLERNLPVGREYQREEVLVGAPIEVSNLVFASGRANAGSKAIASTLPNDEWVREKKGTKQIIFGNILIAKLNKILLPIAEELIAQEQIDLITPEAFVNYVLLHELSHTLGVDYVNTGSAGERVTVRRALRDKHSTIEEAKADAIGLNNLSFFVKKTVLTEKEEFGSYTAFLASAFRSIRFGLSSDHARANMIILRNLVDRAAVRFDKHAMKYTIEFDKMRRAIKELAARLLTLQGDGDYEAARDMIDKMAHLDDKTSETVHRLEKIPVDLEFVFPVSPGI